MKHKVSELEGALLDSAVAKAERGSLKGLSYALEGGGGYGPSRFILLGVLFAPSTSWQDGGPIIERERILLSPLPEDWRAVHTPSGNHPPNDTAIELEGGEYLQESSPRVAVHGATPLIAAMRAFVASKLGEEIDLP
jgi:hypothetical protein